MQGGGVNVKRGILKSGTEGGDDEKHLKGEGHKNHTWHFQVNPPKRGRNSKKGLQRTVLVRK